VEKMNHLHKAKSGEPLFFWIYFFDCYFCDFFFWMFLPKTTIFKKDCNFTAAGIVLTLLMLFCKLNNIL
jgi:hypothetical protein